MLRISSKVALVLVALLLSVPACASATQESSDGETPSTAEESSVGETKSRVEVIKRITGGPDDLETAAAAWTDNAAGLQQLWEDFRLEGTPPALDGQAILFAATGESSSCPLSVTDVRIDGDRVELVVEEQLDAPSETATCTADFSGVTFLLRVDPSVVAPPFEVLVDSPPVRVETADAVASIPAP